MSGKTRTTRGGSWCGWVSAAQVAILEQLQRHFAALRGASSQPCKNPAKITIAGSLNGRWATDRYFSPSFSRLRRLSEALDRAPNSSHCC